MPCTSTVTVLRRPISQEQKERVHLEQAALVDTQELSEGVKKMSRRAGNASEGKIKAHISQYGNGRKCWKATTMHYLDVRLCFSLYDLT